MGKVKSRGNGQGSVYKRGKTWHIETCTYRNGMRIRKYKGGFKTKSAAIAFLGMSDSIRRSVLFCELYQLWADAHYSTITDNKRKAYERAWERLRPLWTIDITDTVTSDLKAIVGEQTQYYPARDCKTVLNGIYTTAIADGVVYSNLAENIPLPKKNTTESECFTEEEIEVMWQKRKEVPFLDYLLIMIYTGMRPGEARMISPEKIDYANQEIVGCGEKTEFGTQAPITFPDKLVPILKSLPDNSWRKDKSWFYEQYEEALSKAGIRYLVPKQCRHTCSTRLARAQTPIATIKRIMRHTSYKTTLGYTHMNHTDELNALNEL